MPHILEQFHGKTTKGTFFLKTELGELITVSNWTSVNAAIEKVLTDSQVNAIPVIAINVQSDDQLDLIIYASNKTSQACGCVSLKLVRQNYDEILVLKDQELLSV